MRIGRETAWLLLGGVVATGIGGCLGVDSRLTNQGGGNLITAAAKAAAGKLNSLTPDEIQIASDFAIDQLNLAGEPLTDDQAEAVVTFLEDNQLKTVDDIQGLADNPGDVVISEEVRTAIEAFLQGLGEDFSFGGPVGALGGDGPPGSQGG